MRRYGELFGKVEHQLSFSTGVPKTMRTLDQLKVKESGVVEALHGEGAVQQRMMEMGVIDGAEVEVLRFAPLGDPMEIFVRGFHLTLRKAEAALVELEA